MANIKSQKKRIITNEKSPSCATALCKVRAEDRRAPRARSGGGQATAPRPTSRLPATPASLMDKAATKGVIHKNQAANRKSGIMALANTIVTPEDIAAYKKPEPKAHKTGSKKAAAKAERKAAMAAASAEKAKRREKQLKEEKKAADRKAKEAAAAAAAEAEEATEEAAE